MADFRIRTLLVPATEPATAIRRQQGAHAKAQGWRSMGLEAFGRTVERGQRRVTGSPPRRR